MPAVNSGRKRERIAAAVLERVHLLRDDVGGLADRAGEHLGRLEHRHLDPLEAVEPAHAVEGLDHLVEAVGLLAQDVLRAPDRLRPCSCAAPVAVLARMRKPRQRLNGRSAVMNIDLIPVGDDPPDSINVIIEVPIGGEPVKYEFDKKSARSSSTASCTRRCAIRPITASCRTRWARTAIRSTRW